MVSWRRRWLRLRGAKFKLLENSYGEKKTITNACHDYMRSNDLDKYDFIIKVYGDYVKNKWAGYSHVRITYPSVSTHYPGFDSILEDFETYVRDFVSSRFDYSIRVVSKMREESHINCIKSKLAKIVPPGIPVVVSRFYDYMYVREEQYDLLKKKSITINNTRYTIKTYSVPESSYPLYDNKSWDYVDMGLYSLGYLNYTYSRMREYYKSDLDIHLVYEHAHLEQVNNNVVDLAELGDDISQIVRDEIERAPNSEEKIIVLPLTGVSKLLFEVVSDLIITRDDANGDYYKVLLFEGREIVLATEEVYDYTLWFMRARSNLINIFHAHRAELNALLRSKDLPWVLKYVLFTDTLGLSERESFLLESSSALLAISFDGLGWGFVDMPKDVANGYGHRSLVDLFNKDFRDRFKALDSRVGRFEE